MMILLSLPFTVDAISQGALLFLTFEPGARANALGRAYSAVADDAYAATNFLKILEGTGKTFIFTSGSAILGGKENGERSDFQFTEDIPLSPVFWTIP